jgi:rhomboid protease GluP
MCPNCRAFITTKDKICPYCDVQVGPRAVDRMGADLLGGLIPSARFATTIILSLNVGIFLLTLLASASAGGGLMNIDIFTLRRFGATSPLFILHGQFWRLLTAGFLHGGLMHIAFNCWALMDVGAHAEQEYGARRMTAIFLISTVGGFAASTLWGYLRGADITSVGASAGLFGLIGAMIAYGKASHGMEASMVKQFYVRWAVYGLLMGLLPFFRVDNAAHIGGLATGFVTASIAGTPRLVPGVRDKVWDWIAGLMIALTAYAFLRMFLFLNATGHMQF